MPILSVTVEEGHVPHAPSRRSDTMPVSVSTSMTLQFPPSAIRYGRTSSSTLSTPSIVNGTSLPPSPPPPPPPPPSFRPPPPPPSNGLMICPSSIFTPCPPPIVCGVCASDQSSPSTAIWRLRRLSSSSESPSSSSASAASAMALRVLVLRSSNCAAVCPSSPSVFLSVTAADRRVCLKSLNCSAGPTEGRKPWLLVEDLSCGAGERGRLEM
mmetsp:Transcript_37857/g.89593  ORF Transcript_37857/g.89593 Transcript_37857/m.89593 type:complete len:212 (+) Transcript_37857:402-1037(+)